MDTANVHTLKEAGTINLVLQESDIAFNSHEVTTIKVQAVSCRTVRSDGNQQGPALIATVLFLTPRQITLLLEKTCCPLIPAIGQAEKKNDPFFVDLVSRDTKKTCYLLALRHQ